VKKVGTHGILIDRKPLKINPVLNKEKRNEIGRQLEKFLRKSLRRLVQQCGFSVRSAWTASKLSHNLPIQVLSFHKLNLRDMFGE
jgi:hypothetical protein